MKPCKYAAVHAEQEHLLLRWLQVGFLYLRYVCNPRELWGWYKKYMHDDEVGVLLASPCSAAGRAHFSAVGSPATQQGQCRGTLKIQGCSAEAPPCPSRASPFLQEFSPSPGSLGKTITMAEFVRDIVLDQVSAGIPGGA